MIKQKNIEIFLQDISDFEKGEKEKWSLEQHMTPPAIAANILNTIQQNEDIENMTVGDFGCGTGMLISGLVYIGCEQAIGLEFDSKYANVSIDTLNEKFEEPSLYDVINTDVVQWKYPQKSKMFDMVLMNPPFGTKEEGIDVKFLEKAIETCDGSIYSLHKSSTRKFLEKKAGEYGRKFEHLQQYKFPLPKRFNKYHKKDMAYTDVDLIAMYKTD